MEREGAIRAIEVAGSEVVSRRVLREMARGSRAASATAIAEREVRSQRQSSWCFLLKDRSKTDRRDGVNEMQWIRIGKLRIKMGGSGLQVGCWR